MSAERCPACGHVWFDCECRDTRPPPLEDDRTAMMLGLVPDKRTPQERLWDAIRTSGESLKYRYEPPAQEGKP